VVENPELVDFRKRLERLIKGKPIKRISKGRRLHLRELSLDEVAKLITAEEGLYFLQAAAGLTRTSLKKAQSAPEADVVHRSLRRAFAIKQRLPVEGLPQVRADLEGLRLRLTKGARAGDAA